MKARAVWTANQVDTSFAERPSADKGLLEKAPTLSITHCVVAASKDVMRPIRPKLRIAPLLQGHSASDEPRGVTSSPFYPAPLCAWTRVSSSLLLHTKPTFLFFLKSSRFQLHFGRSAQAVLISLFIPPAVPAASTSSVLFRIDDAFYWQPLSAKTLAFFDRKASPLLQQ